MSRPDKLNAAPSVPAPRFATGWAALAYALATMALAYPALSGLFLVNPRSDQYIAGFAFRDFAVQALRAGRGIPHWNPYMFGGLPYVAAMHGDIFYPTQLLRLLLGTDVGMTWGFIIHTFLAGLFTYGFLRLWGLGFFPALIGGMAYLLGGPIASYASPGHDGKLFVGALLPLALWLLVRGMRDGRHWAWGALALTLGLAVLSPHPQLLQYMLLMCGAFALFLALGTDAAGTRLDRHTAMRRLAFALGAVLIGLAIGAIQFAPLREYIPYSPRAGGRGYDFATNFSFPIVELINMYLPQFTGILDKYWGPNGIHWHSEYIGGPVLLLATAGLWNARTAFKRFWLGTAVISLLWALGGNTPFFRVIYELVPGTKFFQAPSTIIYLFGFSVAVLAALGTERVLAAQAQRRIALGWAGFALALAILGTAGGLNALAKSDARGLGTEAVNRRGMDPGLIPQAREQYAAKAEENAGAVLAGAWRSAFFVFVAAGIVIALLHGRIPARVAGLAFTLVVALDLWSVERQYWLFSPPARVLYAPDAAIDYLKRDPQPFRVAVVGQGETGLAHPDPYYGTDSQGRGTGLMVHGIRSITGYHGNQLGRYQQLSDFRLAPNAPPVLVSPMFFRHENVRYLYTNTILADTQVKLVVGPIRNSAGSTVYLYKLPGENPYAWVATAMTKAPDSDVLPAVIDPRFDPRRLAVFSDSSTLQLAQPTSLPAPSAITTTTSNFAPGHATIGLSEPSPAGAALVVSENFYPGWTAVVDGRAQPTYRADYNLIGVPLPTGARTVELSFHDAAVDKGKGITVAALLLALVALGGGVVMDRRRLG